jgi:hypothetical protein
MPPNLVLSFVVTPSDRPVIVGGRRGNRRTAIGWHDGTQLGAAATDAGAAHLVDVLQLLVHTNTVTHPADDVGEDGLPGSVDFDGEHLVSQNVANAPSDRRPEQLRHQTTHQAEVTSEVILCYCLLGRESHGSNSENFRGTERQCLH